MRASKVANVDRWPGLHSQGNVANLDCGLLGILFPESWSSDFTEAINAVPVLRDAGVAVAIGFGSAMESMSVELLLEGQQPIVVSFFKALSCYKLPTHWKKAIDAGQLLVIAPVAKSVRRKTRAGVERRNRFIAEIASAVFMPYFLPGDSEAIAREAVANEKPLFTLDEKKNAALVKLSARQFSIAEVCRAIANPKAKSTSKRL